MPEAQPALLYEVVRTVEFANGSAVSIPIKLCSDEASARDAVTEASEQFAKATEAGRHNVLAEFGIIRCRFGIVGRVPPDSRILRPPPGLTIVRD